MTYQTNRVRLDKLVAQYNAQLYDYEEDGFLMLHSDGKSIHLIHVLLEFLDCFGNTNKTTKQTE